MQQPRYIPCKHYIQPKYNAYNSFLTNHVKIEENTELDPKMYISTDTFRAVKHGGRSIKWNGCIFLAWC